MMDEQPDPKKAIYLKPNQRRVPGGRRSQKPKREKAASAWQAHQSDQALDAWGVALRTLKAQGYDF
jgi:hypothetical protein